MLKSFNYNLPTSKKPEIEVIISKIVSFLENKDTNTLKSILIESCRSTFTILWEGEKLSQKNKILAL